MDQVYKDLQKPFDFTDVSWKINNYNGDKTKANITFHLDARAVQNRLNEVVGLLNWDFIAEPSDKDHGVRGTLILRAEGKQAERDDIGYPNLTKTDVTTALSGKTAKDQQYKDAYSDALKRCAVHFGIGMYLYRLGNLWIELDSAGQKYLNKEQDTYIKKWYITELRNLGFSGKKEGSEIAEPRITKKVEPATDAQKASMIRLSNDTGLELPSDLHESLNKSDASRWINQAKRLPLLEKDEKEKILDERIKATEIKLKEIKDDSINF
jgi:hypothetical protein